MLNSLYKFTAYNSQALYGWGDDAEANAYCDFLNQNREINHYQWEEITDEEEIRALDSAAEGVNLSDALDEIGNA